MTTTNDDSSNKSQQSRSANAEVKNSGKLSVSRGAPAATPSPQTPTQTPLAVRPSVEVAEKAETETAETGSGFWPSFKMMRKKRQSSRSSLSDSRRSSRSNSVVFVDEQQQQPGGLAVFMPDDKRRKTSPSSTTTIREEHQAEFSYTDALGITGKDDLMAIESETIVDATTDRTTGGTSDASSSVSRQKKRPQAPLGQYRPEDESSGNNDGSSNVNIGRNKVADATNDDDEEGIDIDLPYKPDLE